MSESTHTGATAERSPTPAPGAAFQADQPSPWIAREGWPIVIGFAVVGVAVSAVAFGGLYRIGLERFSYPVMLAALLMCVWCVWFFRDPARHIPIDPAAAISPADGVVCLVDEAPLPAELREAMGESDALRPRIAVFMNVFNVHVNRAPAAGTVRCAVHHRGRFFNASFDKASELNERLSLGLTLADGRTMASVQIAGLIARRIVCRVRGGDRLVAGQRYGLIRFGSRVDVYLPRGSMPLVKVGDRAVAGETRLARIVDAPEADACS